MKRFFKSLHGRLALVLGLTLLLSVTVIAIHRTTVQRYGMQQQLAAIRQENAVYAAAMSSAFTMLEENLFYLPANNRNFQELVRYGSEGIDDTLEYWSMVSNIRQQLSTLNSTCPYVESFFLYYPEQELFLNEQVNPEMSRHILAVIAQQDSDAFDCWVPVTLEGGSYLLRIYSQRGYYLGAWLECGSLVSYFTNGSKQTTLYSAAGKALSQPWSDNTREEGQLLSDYAEHPGVTLSRFVSYKELHAAARISQTSFAVVIALHVLLLLFVLFAMSQWVLRPIHALSSGIGKIRGGEADYRMPPMKNDSTEFQEIQREFNAMMDETRQMRIRMYEQKLQQDEVKLRYLSQQIQPHFILNSLNMLYAYIGRDDGLARKLIRLLAQYYRYIINIESQYVEIGEEIDHIENYLAFQKIRYSERLQYEIDCDSAVRAVPIPPLMLESFVGNVLKYGQDGEDLISILIKAEKPDAGTVRIRISDRGSGFPGEILDSLKKYRKTGVRDELLGIGICNSMDRLRLIYGGNASIYFYNAEDGGAVVEIIIHQSEEAKQA